MKKVRSKLVLAFSLLIVTSTIFTVLFINNSTRKGYREYAESSDIAYANQLRTLISEYYIDNKNLSGIDNLIQIPRGRMGDMMVQMRGRSSYPPIIITDKNGNILLKTPGLRDTLISKEVLTKGVSVHYKDEIIAYIFTGSMIDNKLTQDEEDFLSEVTMVIIYTSLIILAISILVLYFISVQITKPISSLSIAANRIKNGDYTSRVLIKGGDELSKLGESFNSMAASVEASDKWRKQIIADSAHELRTPITLIQGQLEMILDGVYKPDNNRIESIYNETKLLSKLITELQQLSSAESGSMKLNIEDINIYEFIANILDSFDSGKYNHKVNLINSIPKGLLLKGDKQKLKQVFVNLIENGYRHTPENGTIEVIGKSLQSGAEIIFKDSGSGIPKEYLNNIFERFFRVDNSRNRENGGSGLGLAISKSIIELHNGTIKAISEENRGTSIIIKLSNNF